jgi:hypothetical protein
MPQIVKPETAGKIESGINSYFAKNNAVSPTVELIRFPVTVYAIAWSQAVIKYSNEVIELIVFSVKLSNP